MSGGVAARTVATSRGPVRITTAESPAAMEGLRVDEGIGAFFHHGPAAAERERQALAGVLAREGARATLAVVGEDRIVGYVLLARPSSMERWGGIEGILELSIEVSRAWRGLGLGRHLLHETFAAGDLEETIVVAMGLSWHWDVKASHLSKADYRGMILRLFEKEGFRLTRTNEGNILMDTANVLLVRVGSRVPRARLEAFQATLFPISQQSGSSGGPGGAA